MTGLSKDPPALVAEWQGRQTVTGPAAQVQQVAFFQNDHHVALPELGSASPKSSSDLSVSGVVTT